LALVLRIQVSITLFGPLLVKLNVRLVLYNEGMLTKRDIQQIREALKPDFETFATKDWVKEQLFQLRTEIVQTFATKQELQQLRTEMHLGFKEILEELKAIRQENAANFLRLNQQDAQLRNHEMRLVCLEKPPAF